MGMIKGLPPANGMYFMCIVKGCDQPVALSYRPYKKHWHTESNDVFSESDIIGYYPLESIDRDKNLIKKACESVDRERNKSKKKQQQKNTRQLLIIKKFTDGLTDSEVEELNRLNAEAEDDLLSYIDSMSDLDISIFSQLARAYTLACQIIHEEQALQEMYEAIERGEEPELDHLTSASEWKKKILMWVEE